jgi:hypothetical protein
MEKLTPAYVRTMAAYNSEMNRRLYAAASRLSDAERKRDRNAFGGSIDEHMAAFLDRRCRPLPTVEAAHPLSLAPQDVDERIVQ